MPEKEIVVEIINSSPVIEVEVTCPTVEFTAEIIASGKDGAAGFTPQKGVDYFTDSDISGIVKAVGFLVTPDRYFVHDQQVASNTWIIDHPLGKFPAVTVVDSAGSLVVGDIDYVSNSRVILTFCFPFGGKAYLN